MGYQVDGRIERFLLHGGQLPGGAKGGQRHSKDIDLCLGRHQRSVPLDIHGTYLNFVVVGIKPLSVVCCLLQGA